MLTLKGHGAQVWDVTFSPDGKRIASASLDNTLKIWDTATGKDLLTFTGHTQGVAAVSFSPDGTQLASGSFDGSVKLWDAATGREFFTIKFGEKGLAQVTTVQFSPDGKWLVIGAAESQVRFWDAKSGQELFTLTNPDWSTQGLIVNAISLSPDGNRLAISLGNQAGNSGKIEIWDLPTRQRMLTLYEGSVYPSWSKQMTFSPDGTRFVFSGLDTTPIWDVATGKQLLRINAGVNTIVYSSDGRHLFSASGGGKAQVWDAATGGLLLTLLGTDRIVETAAANSDCIYDVPADWCGTRLVTGASDGSLKVWDITPQGRGEGLILPGIDFSLDGNWTHLTTLTTNQDKPGLLTATFRNWVIPSWTQAGLSQLPAPEAFTMDGPLTNYFRTTLTASGQWLEFFPDGTIKIFDARSQNQAQPTVCCIATSNGLSGGNMDTSPDGKLLAIADNNGAVELWDLASSKKLKDITVTSVPSQTLGGPIAFSPDGTRLATGASDNTIKIWDDATRQLVLTLVAPGRNTASVAFSPDGKLIATGDCDGGIMVWDAATGQLKFKLTGHSACVGELAFSPDSTRLASSSPDKTTRIWDLTTRQEVLTLPEGGLYSRLAFSPDGTRLASANVQGGLHVYLVRMEDLVALAKSRLTRALTPEECQQYLHVEQCPAGP
jgi:WD40 repeat protein